MKTNFTSLKRIFSFTFYIFFLITSSAFAQDTLKVVSPLQKKSKPTKNSYFENEKIVIDGDTVPVIRMHEIVVQSDRVFKNKRDENKYWRMVRNVKKTLPYAKIAKEKLAKYESELQDKSKGQRKRIMKQVEEELVAEYQGELTQLTITQGKVLLKLIDRETGNTSYELVESLRGWFSARFWQGIATLFDTDLKSQYDPKGEDEMMEEIVLKVEKGEL